jgi:hypothetical protein
MILAGGVKFSVSREALVSSLLSNAAPPRRESTSKELLLAGCVPSRTVTGAIAFVLGPPGFYRSFSPRRQRSNLQQNAQKRPAQRAATG